MNARPRAWLRQAENDLALAQLARRDNGFLAQACYDASQASEKGLKSALLELGDDPPHTHVLNDLVGRLKQNGLDTRAHEAFPLRSLSRMAMATDIRPAELNESTQQGLQEYLRFRHLACNLYADEQLQLEPIQRLIEQLQHTWPKLEADITSFQRWLRSIASEST